METEAAPVALAAQTYSVEESSQILGVSPITIYRLVARGLLRPLPHLRHKRIPKRQLHAYLDGTLGAEAPGSRA